MPTLSFEDADGIKKALLRAAGSALLNSSFSPSSLAEALIKAFALVDEQTPKAVSPADQEPCAAAEMVRQLCAGELHPVTATQCELLELARQVCAPAPPAVTATELEELVRSGAFEAARSGPDFPCAAPQPPRPA